MDVYFKDADGKFISIITRENLSDFKKFLTSVDYRDYILWFLPYNEKDRQVRIDEDISFADITKDENGKNILLNDNAQEYLGGVIRQSVKSRDLVVDAIDEAGSYPRVIAAVHDYSGNETGNFSSSMYKFIYSQLEGRPLSENLPLLDALVSKKKDYGSVYRVGEMDEPALKNFSNEQRKHLEHIYRLGKQFNPRSSNITGEQNNAYMANEAFRLIAQADVFANCNMPNDMRADFNEIYLSSRNIEKKIDILDKKSFQDKDLAKIVASGVYMNIPQMNKDTSKARTQAEKNVNIIPDGYKKVKALLLEQAEKEPSYIPGTRGETRTLTEKVQSLALRYYGINYDKKVAEGRNMPRKVTEWKDLPREYKTGIMSDVLESAVHQDIVNGNASKLDKEILQSVLNGDKDAYYSSKLTDEEIKGFKLSEKQFAKRRVSQTNIEQLYQVAMTPYLSTKEKSAVMENTEKANAQKLSRKPQLEAFIAEYDKDMEKYTQLAKECRTVSWETDKVENLQHIYKRIVSQFKDGVPNKHETGLTKEAVEDVISERLKGHEVSLSVPDEGMLPLFGRQTEKERRASLNAAVRSFNETLYNVSEGWRNQQVDDLKPFSGKILEEKTLQEMKALKENKTKELNQQCSEINGKSGEKRYADADLADIRNKEEIIKKSKEIVEAQISSRRKKAKENVGVPEQSSLQAVTKDMDKDTKASVRRKNKSVQDKLAVKAMQIAQKNSSR